MPDDSRQITVADARDLATLPLEQALEAYTPNFAAVLPPNVPVDHFRRMVVTAVNINPELAQADRRSLFNACVKCASDGLLPDGREAALVVYNTKARRKLDDGSYQEQWVKLAQFLPMVAGIRKRLRNSGEVISATAEVVYRNDRFHYTLGISPTIEHEPPPFSEDRGDPLGAYAVIKLKSGEIIIDVLNRKEIEAARAQSRAKDSLMWTKFEGEAWRKTALRRCAKAAPQSAAMEMLARDDDVPEPPPLAELPHHEPEPMRAFVGAKPTAAELQPAFVVIDCDGEERDFATTDGVAEAIAAVFRDAARRGLSHLEAAGENNRETIRSLPVMLSESLARAWRDLRDKLREDPFGLPPLGEAATDRPGPDDSGNSAASGPPLPESAQGEPVGPGDGRGRSENPTEALPAGEAHRSPATAQPAPDHAWLREVAALRAPDAATYIDRFIALVGRADAATLAALKVTEVAEMQKLRTDAGDEYRRAQAAITARVRELKGRPA